MQSLHKQAPPCCNKTRISLSQWSRFWWLFTIIIVIIITIGMCAWWHRVSQWLVTKERNKVSGSQSSQPYNLTATGDQSTTLYDTHYTICTIQPMNIAHNRIYNVQFNTISKSALHDQTLKDRLRSAHCAEGNIPMYGIDWENREGSTIVILGGGPLAWLGH